MEISFKEKVKNILIATAKLYYEVFIQYEYLICSLAFTKHDYYIISARADNFLHLTGVISTLGASQFFERCVTGTLQINDFSFIKKGRSDLKSAAGEKAVKGSVRRKVAVLPQMMDFFKKTLFVEESFHKNTVRCSFAAADNSFTLGFASYPKARPMTLLKGNELHPQNAKSIDVILSRKTGGKYFDTMVLGTKEQLAAYKAKIEVLVDESLICKHCSNLVV